MRSLSACHVDWCPFDLDTQDCYEVRTQMSFPRSPEALFSLPTLT